jgi:peptidoglycan/xylan/chitin deacetylase (PgdA/CDA1 family)
MYHRVAEVAKDPWGMCVSPVNFSEHLQVLQRYSCIPLDQIVRGSRASGDIAVTFDDGYADNLYNAMPELERFDIPATFFIATGDIGGGREFWWDELEQLILGDASPSQIAFQVGKSRYKWNLRTAETLGRSDDSQSWWPARDTLPLRVYRAVYHVLQPMQDEDRSSAMRTIAEASAKAPQARESHRRLNWDEVVELSRHGLVEIGAHTVTHPKLSACNLDRQYFEIKQSKLDLEERLCRPVSSFSYPYGDADHINQVSLELIRQTGFLCACTTRQSAVYWHDDCFRLPRIYVPDLKGDAFEKLLITAIPHLRAA